MSFLPPEYLFIYLFASSSSPTVLLICTPLINTEAESKAYCFHKTNYIYMMGRNKGSKRVLLPQAITILVFLTGQSNTFTTPVMGFLKNKKCSSGKAFLIVTLEGISIPKIPTSILLHWYPSSVLSVQQACNGESTRLHGVKIGLTFISVIILLLDTKGCRLVSKSGVSH